MAGTADAELGQEHDFAFSCVLQNTFNAYEDLRNVRRLSISFSEHCTQLALELYAHAATLGTDAVW